LNSLENCHIQSAGIVEDIQIGELKDATKFGSAYCKKSHIINDYHIIMSIWIRKTGKNNLEIRRQASQLIHILVLHTNTIRFPW
jgi:hypothetical protein